jgi:hypothetical protein
MNVYARHKTGVDKLVMAALALQCTVLGLKMHLSINVKRSVVSSVFVISVPKRNAFTGYSPTTLLQR